MQNIKIYPSNLSGNVFIPPSKSHTMRAILLGSLGKGKSCIRNYLKSPDIFSMIEAMRLFGARIDLTDDTIKIEGLDGKLNPCENVIDAGNSGQILRFLGCLAALLPTYTIITGDHSIRYQRPIQPLLSALTQLEAFATSSRLDGRAPIIIKGCMQPGLAKISGEDSQPISGLLIATSFLSGTTKLDVHNPGEKPWIDLTLSWLSRLGGKVKHQNYQHYQIVGPLSYEGFEINIPGDFSSAAFPLVAALITQSTLTLNNIDMEDVQGDKKIIDILSKMGANFDIDLSKKTLTVLPSHLHGTTIDANDIIDAIPILAVVGCFAEGKTEIINAAIARKKESDRLNAIVTELKKMGALIVEKEDGFIVNSSSLHGASLFSHLDHRIAMALIVAALGANGNSYLQSIDCIAKSYPSFVADFQQAGVQFAFSREL